MSTSRILEELPDLNVQMTYFAKLKTARNSAIRLELKNGKVVEGYLIQEKGKYLVLPFDYTQDAYLIRTKYLKTQVEHAIQLRNNYYLW